MTENKTKLTDTQLTEYKTRIQTLYFRITETEKSIGSYRETLFASVIELGKILTIIKKDQGHGNWLPWIKANCEFTDKTAQNYMDLAKSKHSSILKDCLSIRQGLIAIGRIKEVRVEDEETTTERPSDQTDNGAQPQPGETTKSEGDGVTSTPPKPNENKKVIDRHKKCENLVKQLIETVFVDGGEDDLKTITSLKPLVNLYNEYHERHGLSSNRRLEIPVMDLTKYGQKENEAVVTAE